MAATDIGREPTPFCSRLKWTDQTSYAERSCFVPAVADTSIIIKVFLGAADGPAERMKKFRFGASV